MAAYFAIKSYCVYTTTLFFREIEVINLENLPNEGPVILYGNHNNQFVDGLLLTAVIKRKVHFVAAAASMRRHIIGPMLHASGAIPVQRPQDVSKKGPGYIQKIEGNCIYGLGTQFTKIKLKSILKIQKQDLRVKQVINDRQIITDTNNPQPLDVLMEYKIIPKLEFEELYHHVWKAMDDGHCIGMFPEGGSHDRLQVMPLKAGISIMALGAMEKYNCPVTIVPVGFNYYNPQNFRSKVIMEFGPAYRVPEELVDLYRKDQKTAISTLLDTLQKMLKSVTTEVRTFEQLSTLFLCRELYTLRVKKELTSKEKLELNRRFSRGFDMLVKQPQLKQSLERLKKFNEFVKLNGLSVRSYRKNSLLRDIFSFLFHFQKCAVRLIIALPGILLMGPTTTLIAYQAEKERIKCLKKSQIKAKANDVVGSYKILLSMIYFPITTAFHTFLLFKALQKFTTWESQKCWKICLLIPLLMPIYALGLVKSYDSLGRSFKKLKFLFARLFKRSIYTEFDEKRKQLSKQILGYVQKYGQQVIQDFAANRIVKPEEMNPPSSQRLMMQE